MSGIRYNVALKRQAVDMVRGGMSYSKVSRQLGINKQLVQSWCRSVGVSSPYPGGYPDSKFKPIEHLYGKVPDAELAEQIGVSAAAIFQRRKAKGIPACGEVIKKEQPNPVQELLNQWGRA